MATSGRKTSVTITYSHDGTQPPVFVATSLTDPPWEPLEMSVTDQRTEAGHLIFQKKFDGVEEGEYQYKFRLGPGDWWVMDDTAPKISDDAGNSNNLLVVNANEPASSGTLSSDEEMSPIRRASSAPDASPEDLRLSGETQTSDAASAPFEAVQANIPFTVVNTVQDSHAPVHDDRKTHKLHEYPTKRASDAQMDADYESAEIASTLSDEGKDDSSKTPIPTLVVEKTDERPEHGDDFGPSATQGQQLAHEQRAADAEPDQTLIHPESGAPQTLAAQNPGFAAALGHDPETVPFGMTPAEERAPLFAHEACEPVEPVEEEDEAPLLPHETNASVGSDKAEGDDVDLHEEFETTEDEGGAPLFRHESIFQEHPDSPQNGSNGSTRRSSRTHLSLKDMMAEEDPNDPSLEPFPTRRDTIHEYIQGLGKRLDPDTSEPDVPISPDAKSAERPTSRASTGSDVPPTSPLDAIREDEDEEEQMAEPGTSHAEAYTSAKQMRMDSLVPQESGQDTPKASTDSLHKTLSTVEPEFTTQQIPQQTKPDQQPAKDDHDNDNRAMSPRELPKTPVTDDGKKKPNFLLHAWNAVFGSWLGRLGRFIAGLCGGRRRAT
ncbi:hypothetical protein K490DRAFT_57777 [Saccharata proteae CBS 121410]|uniref:AMP-activated protein kinase glycogen-binding domain-containing protein n=1 Tax=Saccharata proteae CBS 121410 TaxID=1314787 RepID=A0A9P4HTA6_9PEZI|nr:hypothetical protein K490DRAFT_57777 [Saccharata proteae CBS 121410]